jgi:hypothetical protein
MIDTIVLTLSDNAFTIIDPQKFEPSAIPFKNNDKQASRGLKCKQNPTKQELALGMYKPRLTLFSRLTPLQGYKTLLKIEFSAPKLLLGNNFEELTEQNFAQVIQKLIYLLSHMGIGTSAQALTSAPISAIHYAKNIPLTDGSTPYHYINKIKEANIKLSLDVNQTDFRNEGHSFKWHCNSYEIVFYDKIRDLEKAKQSDKRCMEKDSAMQLHLFDELHQRTMLEILRMEVRLGKRTKIKQLLKKLGIESDLSFADLFKTSIARAVLLHYLDEIEARRPKLLDAQFANEKALLVALRYNNPHLTPRRILQLFGLKLALQTMSTRELRTMFGSYNNKGWYRLMADARELKLPKSPNPFAIIRNCLNTFDALRRDLLWQNKHATRRSHMEVI